VALYNTKTGIVEFVLKGHKGSVGSVAWSRDVLRLVTGCGSNVQLWDVSTQQEVAVFSGNTSSDTWVAVSSVALDGSGRILASGF
jgi:WD40 repeat protein